MAEFETPTELVDAADPVRDAGYTNTDAFSPFPIHAIDEALGIKRSILPYLFFAGGITRIGQRHRTSIFRSRVRLSDHRRRATAF